MYRATSQGQVEMTPEEEAEFLASLPEPVVDLKMTGVEILGVMCSATRDDQNGLTAVAFGVTLARMSGQTFPDTIFYFENGNSLVITDENFDHIYSTWTPFRQSFFSPENE